MTEYTPSTLADHKTYFFPCSQQQKGAAFQLTATVRQRHQLANNYNPISGHVRVMSSESHLVAERHSVLPQPYRTLFMIIEVNPSNRDLQILKSTNSVDSNSQQLSLQPC
jgi:hypothetical protein